MCYYDQEQLVKCAVYLRHQRECNGTFSLKEFYQIGEQKQTLYFKARDKQRRVTRLRRILIKIQKAILETELELISTKKFNLLLQNSLAKLEEKSNNILKYKIQTLGVLNSINNKQEIILAKLNFAQSNTSIIELVNQKNLL